MVGLQAMVLGRMGRKPRSSSKSVCSILPIAICGPGLYGAPAFIMSLAALFSFFPIRDWRGLRFPSPQCPKPPLLVTTFLCVHIHHFATRCRHQPRPIGVGLCGVSRLSWKKSSAKFVVASDPASTPVRGSGWGKAGFQDAG
jgi:hypothetical protein